MLLADTTPHDLLSAGLSGAVVILGLLVFWMTVRIRRAIFDEQVRRLKAEEAEADRRVERETNLTRRLDTHMTIEKAKATEEIGRAATAATAEVMAAAPRFNRTGQGQQRTAGECEDGAG